METTKNCIYRGRHFEVINGAMIMSEDFDNCMFDRKPFPYKNECNRNCTHFKSRFNKT